VLLLLPDEGDVAFLVEALLLATADGLDALLLDVVAGGISQVGGGMKRGKESNRSASQNK